MTLLDTARQVAQRAHASGDLLSLPSRTLAVEENGVRYLLRIAENLNAKRRQAPARPTDFNPFLPYEAALYVSDLGPHHVCLLNKFNLVDDHLLIITRAFEPQQSLLSEADFAALLLAMREYDGLAFYNSGKLAGASQPHKHLQLVPRALADGWPDLPLDPRRHPLPFSHHWQPLPVFEAGHWHAAYLQALAALGWSAEQPYNLLLTRDGMLLVPRTAESWQGISVNGIAFAGSFFVRSAAQAEPLLAGGCMRLLQAVTLPL